MVDVSEKHLKNPHVKFFQKQNPNWKKVNITSLSTLISLNLCCVSVYNVLLYCIGSYAMLYS